MRKFVPLLAVLAFSSPNLRASVVFTNGTIHIGDEKDSVAKWLVVDEGKVVGWGNGPIDPKYRSSGYVNLNGRFVMPGIIDSHVHLSEMGAQITQVNLRGAKSAAEAVKLVEAALLDPANNSLTGPLVGNGWDQSLWGGKGEFPTKESLDKLMTKRPIVLYRVDGHAAWANTLALKLAGLWSAKNPPGGKILRTPAGEPTGIVLDTAMAKLSDMESDPPTEVREQRIEAAVNEALSNGVTAAHDMGVTTAELQAIRNLLRRHTVRFRFNELVSAKDPNDVDIALSHGIEVDSEEDQLTVRGVKLFMDGAMGSRGAAFERAYDDEPGNRGQLRMKEQELVNQIKRIDAKGFQVAVHAIGSLANHVTLNAFEKALGKSIAAKRPRLEHAQVLDKDDIARIAKLGVIASMQPVHCTSDMKWVEKRIGHARAQYAYAWNSLQHAGARLAFGSDSPVESINPWHGLFAAITRQDENMSPPGGFFPEQRLTLKNALNAFTRGGAFASFDEATMGSLENGRWADLIVLKEDPMTITPQRLREIKVDETYVGGKKAWPPMKDALSPRI